MQSGLSKASVLTKFVYTMIASIKSLLFCMTLITYLTNCPDKYRLYVTKQAPVVRTVVQQRVTAIP